MSRIGGEPVKSPTRELYVVCGRAIGIAGPSVQRKAGSGWTITRSTTGVYVVVPDINYPNLVGAGAVAMSSATALVVRVSAYTVGGATPSVTFTVFTSSSGSATDLGTSDELWFELAYARTVTP